ncbi:15049_t:CDS:2, partial [Racocetra persica]
ELSGVEFLHLRMAADKFLPGKVIDNLQLFMEQKLEEFVQHDAVGMLQEVFKHNNSIYNPLRDSCLRLICRHPNALFDHPNFTQLDEALLLIVLQLDDLGKLSEITILTYLVKWGIARILNATTKDITKLQKSDYIELQKIIVDCIPLIRWFQIPITEFRQNISWIEKLLSSNLYLDIVNYHFDDTITPETVKILPPRNLPPKDSQEIPKKSLKKKVSFYEDLAHDNERLLQSGKGYDVIIHAGDGDNSKEFHAHSLILSLHSPYFEAAFSNENTMKQGNIFVFTKHVPAIVFEMILRYLYTSEVSPDKLNGVEILQLLVTADELQLQNLVENFQSFMNQKLEEIMRDDIISIFDMIFKYNNRIYESLRDQCLHYICMNPKLLFDDPKFIHLDKSLLKLTLQRDDLGNISEDDIWNYLVKWGIAQTPDIIQSKNVNDWKETDYVTFKVTIHEFIPLIHWFQISSTTFKHDLLFFEKILTNELYNDILQYHLNSIIPNRTFRTLPPRYSPSNHIAFVRSQHFNIISNWISVCTVEKTPETKRKRQSFMEKILHFHDKSSVKPEESKRESTIPQNYLNFADYRFANYITMAHYAKADKNFLFFFESADDLSRSNFARVKKDSYAVEYSSLNGPIFGHSDYKEGYDMCIYNNLLSFGRRNCYPDSKNFPKVPKFEIEDYE